MTIINQTGMLKEQLRIKTLELKKKEAENTQQEIWVKQVLQSRKINIADLKAEILENPDLIQKYLPELSSEVAEKSNPFSFLSNLSPILKESKLAKTAKKLKSENIALTNRFQEHQEEHEAIISEKSLLISEIGKLRKDAAGIDALNQKIDKLEERSRINVAKHENLLEEKYHLATAYDEAVREVSRAQDKAAESAKTIAQLNSDLSILQVEREILQSDLGKIKQNFNNKLKEKARKIELEFDKKVEYLRKQKNRISKFSSDVMEEDTPAWMVTYADMVTLLLTFFILYYSIAAQNLDKFKEAIMGEEQTNIGLIELIDTMTIRTSLNEWTGFQKNTLINEIEKVTTENITLDTGQDRSRVVVRIPGRTLFKPGSADLEKAGWPSLTEIANVFKKYPNYKINIQGHTDDLPVDSVRFPTNWELSAVRATAVLRFFNDKGINPDRMTATGYADTFPLGPNTTAEERAKNRRVEFVLEKIK